MNKLPNRRDLEEAGVYATRQLDAQLAGRVLCNCSACRPAPHCPAPILRLCHARCTQRPLKIRRLGTPKLRLLTLMTCSTRNRSSPRARALQVGQASSGRQRAGSKRRMWPLCLLMPSLVRLSEERAWFVPWARRVHYKINGGDSSTQSPHLCVRSTCELPAHETNASASEYHAFTSLTACNV